jgi:hypothetical protein
MSAQVEIIDLKIEAVMSFCYKVEEKVVAPAVKAVEDFAGHPTLYGLPADAKNLCWMEEEGIRFDETLLKNCVLLGAKMYRGCEPRPAVPARPDVKLPQFCRCGTDYHTLTIKFE